MNNAAMLSVADVAARLKIHSKTARKMMGVKIPATKWGRSWRVEPLKLQKFIDEREVRP